MSQPATTHRPPVRIGTRGSKSAMWQASWVAEQLAARGVQSDLITISTRGDQQPEGSVASLGSDGVFTKELQKALLDGRIDVAVHSLKICRLIRSRESSWRPCRNGNRPSTCW